MATEEHSVLKDAQEGHVNLRVTMVGADYPVNAAVYMSGDYEVTDITTDDHIPAGEVLVPAAEAGGYGTICTPYRRVLKGVTAYAAITAGALVDYGDDVGGAQTVIATRGAAYVCGRALKAAAAQGDLIDVGLF